jgi:cytochrome c551/c552
MKSAFALAVLAAGMRADDALAILERRCVSCHNPEAKMSGFDVSSRAALLKGGLQGVDLVAGDPARSRIIEFVTAGKMPPAGKLPQPEIESLTDWVAKGAPWGDRESLYAARKRAGAGWWALQPPVKPPVPPVAGATNPIDAFVQAKLAEKGLSPAPPASRRTLIRRLHFDLTGLPPGMEDLEADYAETVERLLASPAYGERWARHWLDVARFGETDGGEHNNERFTAWKYRDYVIDAFHSDKPYDQFVREQVAGDLMDTSLARATGFLVAGPWDSVTKKINKDELMARSIRQDELDDMVTATMATFMGLTVNCARCHDHKFDPIPTRDYYRLTAVFHGAGFGERVTATEAEKKSRDAALKPLREEMDRVKKAMARLDSGTRLRLLTGRYREFDARRSDKTRQIPVNEVWNRNRFAPVTASQFRFVVTGAAGKRVHIGRFELLPAGGTQRNWNSEREARPDAPVVFEWRLDQPATVSEIEWSTGLDGGAPRIYRFEYLADGTQWKQACSSLDHISPIELLLPELSEEELKSALPGDVRREWEALARQRDELQKRIDAVPAIESVHAVTPEPMKPAYVLERGSLTRPGSEVAPGALTAVWSLDADLGLPAGATDRERRLALARWLTDRKNPLTARVMVNRVWKWHFGNGIVNTPSDFGYNGDRPSHPELLDWLAVEFMEQGWSVKWLQRLIVSSQTYRQSSRFNQAAHAVDAGNRLLWRIPLKRMDAETLRDSILAVAGNLNPERGGPGYFLQKKAGGGSYMYKVVDYDGPAVWKRSVYRFVVRGGERIFLDSFDCPDPAVAAPERSAANTPVQALTLLNSRFVLGQAESLAKKLERERPDLEGRIVRAYERILQRKPADSELSEGREFAGRFSLALYVRALLNGNEFVYVP